jgi:hypothetical protein
VEVYGGPLADAYAEDVQDGVVKVKELMQGNKRPGNI